MTNAFAKLHPVVNFTFYAFVIALSMFLMNPVCLFLSLICSFANAIYICGRKAVKLSLLYLLPMIILVSIINPVVNHQGVTILTYFPWGNPLTLESVIYGFTASLMLSSVVLWFSSFNSVMTSDKLVCLFGKVIPSLSLVLSMVLRFVPKLSAQFREVRNSQKCIGKDISDGSLIFRLKNLVRILSVMISWSMENAVETADSMKSRGYGLKGRTSYSLYKFSKNDFAVLITTILLGTAVTISVILGTVEFCYYPMIKGDLADVFAVLTYALYLVLMLTPLILNVKEEIGWKRLRSSI